MDIICIDSFIGYVPDMVKPMFNPDTLMEKMDTYRIKKCVTYSTSAIFQHEDGNACITQAVLDSCGRINPCYVLHPNLGSRQMPSAELLFEKLQTEKPAAVRLFPKKGNYPLNSFYAGELLDVMSSLSMPVLLDFEQLLNLDELPLLANQYPDIPFVILGLYQSLSFRISVMLKKTKNIYFDTSTLLDTGFLDEAVGRFGSQRFLFGGGLPLRDPCGALAMVNYGRFDDEDKENIFSRNWERIQEGIKWL